MASMTVLLPLCLLSLIAGSLAVVGDGQCVDSQAGCLDCCKTYTIDGTHIAQPHGCYHSKGNQKGNALPYSTLINHRKGAEQINMKMWQETGDSDQIVGAFCGKAAVELGYQYFGIEYSGECYFGSESEIDVTNQGLVEANLCATKCKWDVGSANTMMIYKVTTV